MNGDNTIPLGHDPALADPSKDFVYRLDYVLYRGNQFTPVALDILDPTVSTLHRFGPPTTPLSPPRSSWATACDLS